MMVITVIISNGNRTEGSNRASDFKSTKCVAQG